MEMHEEIEKQKNRALKNKSSMLGDLNFFIADRGKSGIVKDLRELSRIKQDEQGLLAFFKAKGMRPSLSLKREETS